MSMKWFLIFVSILNLPLASLAVTKGRTKPRSSQTRQPSKGLSGPKKIPAKKHRASAVNPKPTRYPISAHWPSDVVCPEDTNLVRQLKSAPEMELIKNNCTPFNQSSSECLVPLFRLASRAINVHYPMTQCIFGKETGGQTGAPENVSFLIPDSKEKRRVIPATSINYAPEANEGNGKGLGQLTIPAIRAVQELIDPALSDRKNQAERFDCRVHQGMRAFFKALNKPLPNILVTKEHEATETFNPLNPIQNIAVSVAYLYDVENNLLSESDRYRRRSETSQQYRDRITELTARTYNSSPKYAISYGQHVRVCAQKIQNYLDQIPEATQLALNNNYLPESGEGSR